MAEGSEHMSPGAGSAVDASGGGAVDGPADRAVDGAAGGSAHGLADGGALGVLGAVLDGALGLIGEAGADARRMDRQAVHAAADMWVHNARPFVRAVVAGTRRAKERRARKVLRWMADLGAARQDRVRAHAGAAGLRVDPRWFPPATGWTPSREPGLLTIAPYGDLTAERLGDLAAEYDLAAAEVRLLRVERAGDRLDVRVTLALPRGYPATGPGAASPAELHLTLHGVTAVRFDAADTRGAALRLAPGEVALALGERGELRAAACHFFALEDHRWHESAAGRRAAATAPRREPRSLREPRYGYLAPNAHAAAMVLRVAMLEGRGVLSNFDGHRVPLAEIHRTFAGAGRDLLAAGAHRTRRRREAAFRALVETWVRRAGPALDARVTEALAERLHRQDLLAARPARAARPPAPPGPVPPPPGAELRCAWYEAEYVRYGLRQDAYAVLHLAVPPDAEGAEGWRMRALRATGCDGFRLRKDAFAGPADAEFGEDGLVLRGGALAVTAPAGWDSDVG